MTSPADPAAAVAPPGPTAGGATRRSLVGALAVALAIVAIALLVLSMRALQDSRAARAALLADGGEALATITAVTRPGGEVCGLVDARFTDSSGRAVAVTDVDIRPPARRGEEFRIRYDRDEPSRFEVVEGCGDPHGQWRYWLGAATAVLMLVEVVVLVVLWLVLVRRRTRRFV